MQISTNAKWKSECPLLWKLALAAMASSRRWRPVPWHRSEVGGRAQCQKSTENGNSVHFIRWNPVHLYPPQGWLERDWTIFAFVTLSNTVR